MKSYFSKMTNKVFKCLPLMENNNEYVVKYIDGLFVDLKGMSLLHPELCENSEYVSVLNILGYLKSESVSFEVFRREILKATNLLSKLSEVS